VNRIIEAFTRAHDQVTGIDEILMTLTVLAVVITLLSLYFFVAAMIDRK